MSKEPDVVAGLAVRSLAVGRYWYVAHSGSNLLVHDGFLRQRRFAEQARADLLATGVDFTRPGREVSAERDRWAGACRVWSRRAHQDRVDLVTGEHYSWSTHYGQVIPSAAHARRLAAALAAYAWS